MSRPYMRNCTGCGNRIRMAQMDSGQWLPFEPGHGEGVHQCTGRRSTGATFAPTMASTAIEAAIVEPIVTAAAEAVLDAVSDGDPEIPAVDIDVPDMDFDSGARRNRSRRSPNIAIVLASLLAVILVLILLQNMDDVTAWWQAFSQGPPSLR